MLFPIDYLLGMGAWLATLAAALFALVRWRQRRRRAKRSLHAPHLGLFIWMAFATLTVPELLTALAYDATDSFSQTNVSKRWYVRHVRPNRAGYRDARELPTNREAGQHYVAFIGDSFTFGHGVNAVAERFSDRIGAAMAQDHVVVFNTGLPGMDVRQCVEVLLPEFAVNHTPIDVLVYTFVPNDIEYLDERTAAFYQQRASRDPEFFLFKHTYFYNLLYHRLQHLASGGRGDYYGYLAESYTGDPWPRFAQKLNEMQAWCRSQHAELQVVIFPFLTTLGDHDLFLPAYAAVERHCFDQGIACANLTATMTAHLREGLVVSRFDAHPNERAHALAAETLLPVLRERLSSLQHR